MRPLLLDAFCGAGGATRGYQLAGFEVVGVDIKAQPHYCGDKFIQADALAYIEAHGSEYAVMHASPPCQGYSETRVLSGQGSGKAGLVAEVRALLRASGRPYVIENVVGAPLIDPTLLCGLMFGLHVYRHRLFESSVALPLILHPWHHVEQVKLGRRVSKAGERQTRGGLYDPIIQVAGHFVDVAYAREALGIDWMVRNELAQAIPPAYTEWLGQQIIESGVLGA